MSESLYCLKHRANINTFLAKGKTVVVYEDHRYVLNILKFAIENKILEKATNVISLDYHSDSYDNPNLLTIDNISMVKGFELKEFWNFIEFEHSNQDDDWVVSGMEYGLINDIAMLFVREVFSGIDFNQTYIDKEQNIHNAILINAKSELIEFQAFNKMRENQYVLDIDLDFATKMIEGKNIPFSKNELDHFFNQNIKIESNNNLTFYELFKKLIENASFITICKESGFCGGFLGSNSILNYIDEKFFDNELMK